MLAGLPPDQFEWQFADPSSSIARAKYRPGDDYAYSCSLWDSYKKVGVYGRLDKDGFFPTTVTNMDPTAKQCRVLHPSVCYLSELYIPTLNSCSAIGWSRSVNWRDPKDFLTTLCLKPLKIML